MMPRLSTLQFNMLRMFASDSDTHMTIVQAQQFDQRPFRSMLIREWIAYRPGRGFHITRAGRAAYDDFEQHDITRKNHDLPLTSYFDAAQYGLRVPAKKAGRAGVKVVAAAGGE
jgi:hypothetical protein